MTLRPCLSQRGLADSNAAVPAKYFTVSQRYRWRLFPSRRGLTSCGIDEDPSSNISQCGALWQADRKSRSLPDPRHCARLRPAQSICRAEKAFVAFLGIAASLMLTPLNAVAIETPEFTASTALRKILPYVVPNQSVEGKCFNDVSQSLQSILHPAGTSHVPETVYQLCIVPCHPFFCLPCLLPKAPDASCLGADCLARW